MLGGAAVLVAVAVIALVLLLTGSPAKAPGRVGTDDPPAPTTSTPVTQPPPTTTTSVPATTTTVSTTTTTVPVVTQGRTSVARTTTTTTRPGHRADHHHHDDNAAGGHHHDDDVAVPLQYGDEGVLTTEVGARGHSRSGLGEVRLTTEEQVEIAAGPVGRRRRRSRGADVAVATRGVGRGVGHCDPRRPSWPSRRPRPHWWWPSRRPTPWRPATGARLVRIPRRARPPESLHPRCSCRRRCTQPRWSPLPANFTVLLYTGSSRRPPTISSSWPVARCSTPRLSR